MPTTSKTVRLTLAYDGTGYHGWQVQPTLPSIQSELARALHHVAGETILPQASGRTDAGVHALGQVVSFVLHTPIPLPNLHRALNRALPPAIRVLSAQVAPNDFHARYSARAKTYEYRLFNRFQPGDSELICPPTLARYLWDCPWRLDLPALQLSASQILGEHDFTSFAAVDPEHHTTEPDRPTAAPTGNLRHIYESSWTIAGDPSGSLLIYRVRGSGFLHHMVRNLVGTFVDIARGAATIGIPQTLAEKSRSAAGPTAPAHGLFLINVEYP
jgi:tRNA pseudouridine38-40 synthase